MIISFLDFIHLKKNLVYHLDSFLIFKESLEVVGKTGDQKLSLAPGEDLSLSELFKSSPKWWAPIFTKLLALIFFQTESKFLHILRREWKYRVITQPISLRKRNLRSHLWSAMSLQKSLSAVFLSNCGTRFLSLLASMRCKLGVGVTLLFWLAILFYFPTKRVRNQISLFTHLTFEIKGAI